MTGITIISPSAAKKKIAKGLAYATIIGVLGYGAITVVPNYLKSVAEVDELQTKIAAAGKKNDLGEASAYLKRLYVISPGRANKIKEIMAQNVEKYIDEFFFRRDYATAIDRLQAAKDVLPEDKYINMSEKLRGLAATNIKETISTGDYVGSKEMLKSCRNIFSDASYKSIEIESEIEAINPDEDMKKSMEEISPIQHPGNDDSYAYKFGDVEQSLERAAKNYENMGNKAGAKKAREKLNEARWLFINLGLKSNASYNDIEKSIDGLISENIVAEDPGSEIFRSSFREFIKITERDSKACSFTAAAIGKSPKLFGFSGEAANAYRRSLISMYEPYALETLRSLYEKAGEEGNLKGDDAQEFVGCMSSFLAVSRSSGFDSTNFLRSFMGVYKKSKNTATKEATGMQNYGVRLRKKTPQ